MALPCLKTSAFILKARLEEQYSGGLEGFRKDWPNRAEDHDLVRVSPKRDVDSRGLQFRLLCKGLRPGRDYALSDDAARPARGSDGIVFERTMDIAEQILCWRVRSGEQACNVISFPKIDHRATQLLKRRDCAPSIIIREDIADQSRMELQASVTPEGRVSYQCIRDHLDDEGATKRWEFTCCVVRPELAPQVLVELLADRFASEVEFSHWLKEKKIDCEMRSGQFGTT